MKALLASYLLLVSFYSGDIKSFDSNKITRMNESYYNGVAVPLINQFNAQPYDEKSVESTMALLKDKSKKHIWPWIYFNRFVGYSESGRAQSLHSNNEYFKNIKGLDLYNESGALKDFLNIYESALLIAKQLGAPGIVIDPEAYNNYDAYKNSYLIKRQEKSAEEIKNRLMQIGRDFTDIADKKYPEAVIWFLFSGLSRPVKKMNPFEDKEYRTVTYIIRGMLERAKEKGSKLVFVSGGESSLGYCYKSLDDMKDKIKARNADYAGILESYPNLKLGGTISPWDKVESKGRWMLTGKCGQSSVRDINDFKQLLRELTRSYKFNWIYAAQASQYNPYDEKSAFVYNKLFEGLTDECR
jgi:hypothetical protein